LKTFRFSCHRGLACFTACCRDTSIFLTPYDVLRMKRRLGLSSGEFLARYTRVLVARPSGLPMVVLRMGDDPEKKCPFVTPEGCRIYEDRPWACRMAPVDVRDAEPVFILESSLCHGQGEAREWSLDEWTRDQGLDLYDTVEETFREVTSHPRLQAEGITDPAVRDMFLMACYDVDRFRRFVFESRFLKIFDLPDELVAKIREDETALLELGFRWVKFGLIDPGALKVRDEVLAARRPPAREAGE